MSHREEEILTYFDYLPCNRQCYKMICLIIQQSCEVASFIDEGRHTGVLGDLYQAIQFCKEQNQDLHIPSWVTVPMVIDSDLLFQSLLSHAI